MKKLNLLTAIFHLILTVSVCSYANPKTYDYSFIDKAVLQYGNPDVSMNEIVDHFSTIARNEQEKVRAIYLWISKNINYDNSFSNYYAEETFRDRTGVCNGFATLFDRMCEIAGLESKLISGYAKGAGYQPGAPKPISNHAWNAVMLNGKWYPIECTWASCIKEYDYYFLTDPEQFIFSHLPLNESYNYNTESWNYSLDKGEQLLQEPINYALWETLPNIYAGDMVAYPNYYTLNNFSNGLPSDFLAGNYPTKYGNHQEITVVRYVYSEEEDDVKTQQYNDKADFEDKTVSYYSPEDNSDNVMIKQNERPVLNDESITFLQSFKKFVNSPEFKAMQRDIEIKSEVAYTKFKKYYDSGEMESDVDGVIKNLQDWWQSDSVKSFKEESKSAIKSGLQSLMDWMDE